MKTFTKRADVVEHLVAQGFSELLANVVFTAYFEFDGFGVLEEKLDELQVKSLCDDFIGNGGYENSEGIWLGNELLYSAEGNCVVTGANILKTMNTCSEVIEYLVSKGTNRGLARAAVIEYLSYDDSTNDDLLSRYGDGDERILVSLTETEAYEFWEHTGDDDFEVMEDGIYFDGEHTHDLQGFHI